MSHILNHTAPGYRAMADWPTEAPDRLSRDKAVRISFFLFLYLVFKLLN